jgi:Ca2+:H+ antiporter
MADGAMRQRAGNGYPEPHDAEKGAAVHKHSLHMPHRTKGGKRLPRGINAAGESGRRGIHPLLFLKACFRSSSIISTFVNILWPFVIPAIALHFARPELHKWIFALNYIAMVPTANLIGYAGQELARKLPKVFGMYTKQNTGLSVLQTNPYKASF